MKELSENNLKMSHETILKNFGFNLVLEMSQSEEESVPNVSVQAELPRFLLNISDFTYSRMLEFSDSPPKNKAKVKDIEENRMEETIMKHTTDSK